MIQIGSHSFNKLPSVEDNLRITQQILSENNLIIVDKEGIPLPDEVIVSRIQNEDFIDFDTKSAIQIEQETLTEAINYIIQVEPKIETLQESDEEKIISGFVDVMESVMYLDTLVSYFNFQMSRKYDLEKMSGKALRQAEDGNTDYLLDLLDFEIIPILEEMKTNFTERLNS